MLKTNLSQDLLTSATRILIKYEEVDNNNGKLVEKLLKS